MVEVGEQLVCTGSEGDITVIVYLIALGIYDKFHLYGGGRMMAGHFRQEQI